jgi:hypothetical protein
METSLFNRLQATLLAAATVGLFLLAALNLVEERHYQQPVDGVWWREAPGGLEADKVLPDSPDLERVLYRTQIYGKAGYQITRDGIPLDTVVHPGAAGPQPGHGPARHRPHLSGHRHLRPLPPLDSSPRHPLLSLLPGLVCALCAQVHRQASTRSGLDRFLVQCAGRVAAAGALPAFCPQLP